VPGDGAEGSSPGTGTGTAPDLGPERRLVIEGNRAWVAARNVRKRWLADTLLTRRTAPKQAMPFITAQLLTMPQALRDALTRAPKSQLFTDLAGQGIKPDAIGAWAPARLPLALLAVIATAYEDRMDGDAGRATWRTDQRFTQCDRGEAGTYLRFLRDTGYELSPVEQAVADGVPYAGDEPQGQPSEPQDGSGWPGDPGDPAEADPESRNGADADGQVPAP
jgi:ParB family chromosome partitioning protein